MTKVKFVLFIFYRLLYSSVNHTLIHENFELLSLKTLNLLVKFYVIDQMVCWEQIYTKC